MSLYQWLQQILIQKYTKLQMKIDSLKLPIDYQKVRIHREANRLGKRYVSGKDIPDNLVGYGKVCQQCGKRETHCPNFKFCQGQEAFRQRYGYHGPNCVIYLGFIKRIVFFMLICVIIYCIPLLVLNLVGTVCKNSTKACTNQDVIYYWSTYNVIGENPGSLPHHIIWLVLSLTMCGFTLYLRKYSLQAYRIINNRNTTDTDFSIILRRLPSNTTQNDIKELIEHQVKIQYDQQEDKKQSILEEMENIRVRNIIMAKQFSEVMEINDKNVDDLKKYVKEKYKKNQEIQQQKQEANKGKPQKKGKKAKKEKEVNISNKSLATSSLNGNNSQNHGPQSIENPQFVPEPLPVAEKFACTAIVRFNDSRQKDLVLKTVKISFWMNFIVYFFPFYNPFCQYKILNKPISISKAPEPEDIFWQNFGISENFRIARKILASTIIIGLLLVSSAISISVSIWIESLLASSGIQPLYLTILLVFVTLLINVIIQIIIGFLIQWMRLDTMTDQMCEQLSVTVLNQSFNLGFFSIFAPILAKLPSFIQLNTSQSSSFPVIMFTTIIIQSFIGTTISFLLAYYQVIRRVLEYLDRQKIMINTQTEAYKKFKNVQVPFVDSYAHNVKILWFSFIYGVVSPICVFIGLIGMVLYYIYQKLLFNSKYSIPVYGGSRINSTMIDLMDFCPFLIGIFNFFLYQTSIQARNLQSSPAIQGIVITNAIIGGAFAIFPWRILINSYYNQKQSNRIDYFEQQSIPVSYQKTYPAYDPQLIAATRGFIKFQNLLEQKKEIKKINMKQYIGSVMSQQKLQDFSCTC